MLKCFALAAARRHSEALSLDLNLAHGAAGGGARARYYHQFELTELTSRSAATSLSRGVHSRRR